MLNPFFKTKCKKCGKNHSITNLTGDYIILGGIIFNLPDNKHVGFYGSNLKLIKSGLKDWLSYRTFTIPSIFKSNKYKLRLNDKKDMKDSNDSTVKELRMSDDASSRLMCELRLTQACDNQFKVTLISSMKYP